MWCLVRLIDEGLTDCPRLERARTSLPRDWEVLTADSPVGKSRWPYTGSQAESELIARSYQERGAPVVRVLPAAVWGPNDPHFGEGSTLAANVLKDRYPIVMNGGMQIADVRDLAEVLAACSRWAGGRAAT
jgi:dihydroflavonol-4-reductase